MLTVLVIVECLITYSLRYDGKNSLVPLPLRTYLSTNKYLKDGESEHVGDSL